MDSHDDWLNDQQFEAAKLLLVNWREAFLALPDYMQRAFHARVRALSQGDL